MRVSDHHPTALHRPCADHRPATHHRPRPGRAALPAALALIPIALASCTPPAPAGAQEGPTQYVRYEQAGEISYGILENGTVHQLRGDLFGSPERTGSQVALADVRLLAPAEPSKIIAVGLNYLSHLAGREPAEEPGLFAKYPTSIADPGDTIWIPADANNLHYEGELVLVIGRTASHVSADRAMDYVFGVTAGNDLSERDWQDNDLQWLRAKASDGFAPVGPVISSGLDYGNLLVQTRVDGEVRQSERSSDLIFDLPTIVSYVSRYITLNPGDLIFTGTPGTTQALSPGETVEIEVEGVGVLSNPVGRRAASDG